MTGGIICMVLNLSIFHTTYLFPGCSGGGIWDSKWRLIGINMQENTMWVPNDEEIKLGEALSIDAVLRWLSGVPKKRNKVTCTCV